MPQFLKMATSTGKANSIWMGKPSLLKALSKTPNGMDLEFIIWKTAQLRVIFLEAK